MIGAPRCCAVLIIAAHIATSTNYNPYNAHNYCYFRIIAAAVVVCACQYLFPCMRIIHACVYSSRVCVCVCVDCIFIMYHTRNNETHGTFAQMRIRATIRSQRHRTLMRASNTNCVQYSQKLELAHATAAAARAQLWHRCGACARAFMCVRVCTCVCAVTAIVHYLFIQFD